MELHGKIIESATRLEEFPRLERLLSDKKLRESGFRFIFIEMKESVFLKGINDAEMKNLGKLK